MVASRASLDDPSALAGVVAAATRSDRPELRVEAGGRAVRLSGTAAEAVLAVLRALDEGASINVESLPAVLTTGQAAEVLGVSRPTVVALIDTGKLSAVVVGTHRRVRLADVLALRERQGAARREALRELTQLSEELGLYDA